jgi:hypothetical protein
MERTALAAVLPVSFRWSDIGSWNAVWDAQEAACRGDEHQQQPDPLRGHRAHHRHRPGRRHHHRDHLACGAGQGPGRAAQDQEPDRGAGAPPRLPPMGFTRAPIPGRATRSGASA